jgi:hypothetical protein
MTIQNIYAWVRMVLRLDDTVLTDDMLELIVDSCIRRLKSRYPIIGDPLALTGDDAKAFEEAAGYLAAALWVMFPRPEGEEVIVRFRIAQIEEAYKVTSFETLMELFNAQAWEAIRLIEAIADDIIAAYADGAGMLQLFVANPARYEAEQAAIEGRASASPLAELFRPRQSDIVGDLKAWLLDTE